MKISRSLYLSILLLAVSGCATALPGLKREQILYSYGTNAVAFTDHYVLPLVPAPWNGIVGGVTALSAALLAMWNLNQEKRLRSQAKLNGAVPKS